MGVDDGGQKGSKEGLIFKIPFTKLKNKSKSLKIVKIIKNDKNSKSDKIDKIRKVRKSSKLENVKSEKVTKCKTRKVKNVKKHENPKNPKMSDKWHFLTLCEIRAAWSGTFSIPGGTTGPDS